MRPAILLVDDDPTLLSVLSRRMTREGIGRSHRSVRQCGAGCARGRLAGAAGGGPDDARHGWFRALPAGEAIADLPIIVLSSVDASESKVRALEQYAEDYITKPFDPDELVARIQRVLRRAAIGRPLLARWRRGRDRPGGAQAVHGGRHQR